MLSFLDCHQSCIAKHFLLLSIMEGNLFVFHFGSRFAFLLNIKTLSCIRKVSLVSSTPKSSGGVVTFDTEDLTAAWRREEIYSPNSCGEKVAKCLLIAFRTVSAVGLILSCFLFCSAMSSIEVFCSAA